MKLRGRNNLWIAVYAFFNTATLVYLGLSTFKYINGHFPFQEPPQLFSSERWKPTPITITLDHSLRKLHPRIEGIIKSVFQKWKDTGADIPEVKFAWNDKEARPPSLFPDEKNIISYKPIKFKGHESDLAITIGFSDPITKIISEADIVISSDYTFSIISNEEVFQSKYLAGSRYAETQSCRGMLDEIGCSKLYDIENVLTHEIGHFFGLSEDFDNPRTTMYSCTSACEIHKRIISDKDSNALVSLYSSKTSLQ